MLNTLYRSAFDVMYNTVMVYFTLRYDIY